MIVAVFKDNDDYTKAYGLWQWDYGQELRIQGLNLPTAVEIHFALQETGGEAPTRIGITKDGITTVPIPDSVLEGAGSTKDFQIYAWVYLADTISGETIKRIVMPVKARSKPDPFEKPGDREIFEQAIELVNKAVKRAEDLSESAIEVGEEAKEAAAEAGEHLEAVQGLAEQVEVNADAVAQGAKEAEKLLSQTQQAASDVALSEQVAKQSQMDAEQAQAGAEEAEDAARQYAAETEADRQEVAEDKQAVSQMRVEVAVDREAVESAVAGFDGKVQGAMGEIADAGKTQVDAINSAGQVNLESIDNTGKEHLEAINSAVANKVSAIETAGQTAVQAVETAKNKAVKAVETKGTEQIGIVAAEGAKQLDEIARVMATIPEDYAVLSELADSNYRTKAPVIIENVSGSLIELKDASDLPMQGLTVYGKSTQRTTTGTQIITNKRYGKNHEVGGVTFKIFEDGSVYINGTNITDAEVNTVLFTKNDLKDIGGLEDGQYFLSGNIKGSNVILQFWEPPANSKKDNGDGVIVNFTDSGQDYNVAVVVKPGTSVNNVTLYPMFNKGETALPFEPYTGGLPAPNPNYSQEIESAGEEVEVKVTGKNLADLSLFDYGEFYQVRDDVITQTINDNSDWKNKTYCKIKKGKYTMSVIGDTKRSFLQIGFKNKNVLEGSRTNTKTFEVEEDCEISYKLYGADQYPIRFRVQIELGDKDTSYEPPKNHTAIHSTPNDLLGIPVTSGGNYTAPDGQQWVCDTIEWDRASGQREYVKRVGNWLINRVPENISLDVREQTQEMHITFPADSWSYVNGKTRELISDKFRYIPTDTWGRDELGIMGFGGDGKNKLTVRVPVDADSQYFVNNPANVLYILAEPIRTPLTADQIKSLESLCTFHPTSIISNDAGSDMEVIYAADTKAYIDSKIDALSKTILDAIAGGN